MAECAKTLSDDAAGQSARYQAYAALKVDVESLYNSMYAAVGGDDFKNFKLAYDDFWGDDDLMRHDAYPALARGYNRTIGGFPGALVAGVTGATALETFGG